MGQAAFDLGGCTVFLRNQIDFADWRDAARRLALNGVRPEEIVWEIGGHERHRYPPSSSGLTRGSTPKPAAAARAKVKVVFNRHPEIPI
jgi:hypothetical protein